MKKFHALRDKLLSISGTKCYKTNNSWGLNFSNRWLKIDMSYFLSKDLEVYTIHLDDGESCTIQRSDRRMKTNKLQWNDTIHKVIRFLEDEHIIIDTLKVGLPQPIFEEIICEL